MANVIYVVGFLTHYMYISSYDVVAQLKAVDFSTTTIIHNMDSTIHSDDAD